MQKHQIINLNDLRVTEPNLANSITQDPLNTLPTLPRCKIIGSISETHSPRTINSFHLSKLIAVEGIVTSVSLVKPKLIKSVHFSENSNKFYEKDYRDSTMITKLPITNTVYPTKDADGYLNTEFGLSEFIDYQTIVVQELVEDTPLGQIPRNIELILTEDLVDLVKPGDRNRFIGVYKALGNLTQGFPNRFKTVLIVNNIEPLNKEAENKLEIERLNELKEQELGEKGMESLVIEGEFITNTLSLDVIVREVSRRKDIINIISNSIAPSIYGHLSIKRALALLLVGGNEIIRKNLSRTRGDINILLVGDPGTAKSQMLRYVQSISPLCLSTTGRGTTGVGLTAAVVVDKETGDKRLDAGVLVLADRGIVCIDEFDKMDDDDRVFLHEVMEQQTISINKAGISATLNCRTSILAAANPILGNYRETLSPSQNIGLQESLLTRFDLIFIVLDKGDDEKIANHILNRKDNKKQLFLREYLRIAKSVRPRLTDQASLIISKAFVELRQCDNSIINVTPRILESLIRLSTAITKLKLKEEIEEEEAYEAINILKETLIIKTKKEIKEKKEDVNKEEIITTFLYNFRDNNLENKSISFGAFYEEIKGLDVEEKDLREVLNYLHGIDVILFYDETIFFL